MKDDGDGGLGSPSAGAGGDISPVRDLAGELVAIQEQEHAVGAGQRGVQADVYQRIYRVERPGLGQADCPPPSPTEEVGGGNGEVVADSPC